VPALRQRSSRLAVNITVAGKGSTGRTEAKNLNEQLAMKQVYSNPLQGAKQLNVTMSDSRWSAKDGWVKMSQNVNGTEIHFVYNTITKAFDDFKFK
jgi:filamentous hemagglutinin